MDTKTLKTRVDLRMIVEQDLGPASMRSRRAHLWKCPFHNERKGYSLAVWQDGYRCFGKCNTGGDVFDWLQDYRQLRFPEALAILDNDAIAKPQRRRKLASASSEPPPAEWQRAARDVIEQAEATLWSNAGEPARQYLYERGLTSTVIRDARLGYLPGDYREWKALCGLNVPCGILIP